MNYYNEFDPHAAAWLRELIARKLIPDGIVDERSITEIHASDLQDFTQCHFFAGLAGWSLALQLAGVSPDTRLWTGSCPCQPFSSAGKGEGKEDERHLWPVFFDLIQACRPPVVFGEQVASALVVGKAGGSHREEDGPVWLDGVFDDLEGAGYTCGASVLGAFSVGAPHIRQRLYWVAHTSSTRHAGAGKGATPDRDREDSLPQRAVPLDESAGGGSVDRLANTERARRQATGLRSEIDARWELEPGRASGRLAHRVGAGLEGHAGDERDRDEPGRIDAHAAGSASSGGAVGGLGDTRRQCDERRRDSGDMGCQAGEEQSEAREWERRGDADRDPSANPWSDSVWLICRDGKHRRVPAKPVLQPVADGLSDLVGAGWGDLLEATPGLAEAAKGFPLASGDPFKLATRGTVRPALLKGAGNAIVPQTAALFIEAFYEVT